MAEEKFPIVNDFEAFIQEFKDESDRAIVVLTAARLDFLLSLILQKYLVANAGTVDEFFENQGPGSTFSNKIMLVFRLGLIDSDFARTLHLVRKIRNDFAHETAACSLEKGSHKDRIRGLVAPYKDIPFFARFKRVYFKDIGPSRADYMTVVGLAILRLHYLFEVLGTIPTETALSLFSSKMRASKEKEK
ncbi:MAG: hypothetical protein NTX17_02995 [Candidatus Eisenbacteria bacterium]|nr:hypothetical protein [Candidatus Eisenbacteria bacterium]